MPEILTLPIAIEAEALAQSRGILTSTLEEIQRAPARRDGILKNAAAGLRQHIQGNDTFVSAFHRARQERREAGNFMPDYSLALLMTAHGVNKIYFDLGIYDYPEQLGLITDDPNVGAHAYEEKVYNDIAANHLGQFQQILSDNYIHSSIPQRGLVFRDIIRRVHGSHPIIWADIGASDGRPVKWAAYPDLFSEDIEYFNDRTCYQGKSTITRDMSRMPLKKLIAIDPENPLADEDKIRWLLANRLPGQATIKDVEQTKREIAQYSGDFPNYEFREGTMFDPPVKAKSCHVVTASTVLAHIDRGRQNEGILAMQNLLTPGGVLILQDYLKRDNLGHPTAMDTHHNLPIYSTWAIFNGKAYHVYSFEKSDCTGIVEPGEDFTDFMEATE